MHSRNSEMIRLALLALLAVACASSVAVAQDPTPGVDLPTDARSGGALKKSGIVGIPVGSAGPTFGFTVGGVIADVFHADQASQRSAIGIGGAYAERSSWMVGVGGRIDFDANAWRSRFGLIGYEVRYQYFGVGNAAGDANHAAILKQEGNSEMAELLHRVYGPFYAGIRYRIDDAHAAINPGDIHLPFLVIPGDDSAATIGSLGVSAEWDSRNDEVSPRSGTFSKATAMYARDWLASDRTINEYDFWINHYIPVKKHDVLALRATACGVGDAAPVWQLCMFGTRADLRGFVAGRYRDRAMFSGQGEYRAHIVGRLGASVFGGVGEVAPSWSDFSGNHMLASGGAGIRFVVSREHRATFTSEYAFANHAGGAFYFRVGEAY